MLLGHGKVDGSFSQAVLRCSYRISLSSLAVNQVPFIIWPFTPKGADGEDQ